MKILLKILDYINPLSIILNFILKFLIMIKRIPLILKSNTESELEQLEDDIQD